MNGRAATKLVCTIGPASEGRIGALLDAGMSVARLNFRITVEEKSFVLDVEEREKYGVDKAPAVVFLRNDQDTRIRMYGAPTGYEFIGFVEAILLAGTGKVELEPSTLALINAVDKPTNIQVFSTPT